MGRLAILRPIDWNDCETYQAFFRAASGTAVYANSWTYITQACRGLGLGWKYQDGYRLFSVGRHNGHFVIVNPQGVLDDRLEMVIAELHRISGKPVFIKKVSMGQAAALEKIGCIPTCPDGYRWDDSAHADDDTYPELIVDLEVSLGYSQRPREWFEQYRAMKAEATAGREHSTRAGYRQFRRSVRKFSSAEIGCEILPYRPDLLAAIKRWVKEYFGGARPDAPRVYDNLLAGLCRGMRESAEFCFVVRVAGGSGIDGMIFGERLDGCSAAIYARLIRRTHSGLPEYAMAHVLSRLKQQGIRRLNLGGSETFGLHAFKKKLAPIEERTLPLLVYGSRNGY